jgi:hypothetical protein
MVATYDLDFLGSERSAALERGVGTSFALPSLQDSSLCGYRINPKSSPLIYRVTYQNFCAKLIPSKNVQNAPPKA